MHRAGERRRQPRAGIAFGRVELGLGDEQGLGEVGAPEVGAPEIGSGEVGQGEVGAPEVGADEAGPAQAGALKVGTGQACADQVGALTSDQFAALSTTLPELVASRAVMGALQAGIFPCATLILAAVTAGCPSTRSKVSAHNPSITPDASAPATRARA